MKARRCRKWPLPPARETLPSSLTTRGCQGLAWTRKNERYGGAPPASTAPFAPLRNAAKRSAAGNRGGGRTGTRGRSAYRAGGGGRALFAAGACASRALRARPPSDAPRAREPACRRRGSGERPGSSRSAFCAGPLLPPRLPLQAWGFVVAGGAASACLMRAGCQRGVSAISTCSSSGERKVRPARRLLRSPRTPRSTGSGGNQVGVHPAP